MKPTRAPVKGDLIISSDRCLTARAVNGWTRVTFPALVTRRYSSGEVYTHPTYSYSFEFLGANGKIGALHIHNMPSSLGALNYLSGISRNGAHFEIDLNRPERSSVGLT